MLVFYSEETAWSLSIVGVIILSSIYLHFIQKSEKSALFILILGGLVLRFLMASIDPFLQDWDERFHAIVARNMIDFPFKPMLRIDPVMPFKMEDWCCNHIWIHKQPLFLWQMALSMFIFGVNEVAMRWPSVIMGVISIYMIYDIARLWTKNIDVAFLAGLLFAVSYYQLELTSGRFSLDQNDATFAFYVTASTWAFFRYLSSPKKIKWAILIGLFVGCAILNKWLTGLLIYGGWGLYLLLSADDRFNLKSWKYIAISFVTCVIVFLPWQLYIMDSFPVESAIMYEHNERHIFEALDGHFGTNWYHLSQIKHIYGEIAYIFFPIGLFFIFKRDHINQKLNWISVAMIAVVYGFFSIIVMTKMPAFVFPVNALIWIIISYGIVSLMSMIKWKGLVFYKLIFFTAIFSFLAFYTLKPLDIMKQRSVSNEYRNSKINNTNIYKSLDTSGDMENRIMINCKLFEDVELMFYQDVNAFHWYPTETVFDSLVNLGYKFAAFNNHNNQALPDYIRNSPEVRILNDQLK